MTAATPTTTTRTPQSPTPATLSRSGSSWDVDDIKAESDKVHDLLLHAVRPVGVMTLRQPHVLDTVLHWAAEVREAAAGVGAGAGTGAGGGRGGSRGGGSYAMVSGPQPALWLGETGSAQVGGP